MLEFAKKDEIIVGDLYYGLEYGFLNELRGAGISMVFRIRNKLRIETVEELALADAARAAGVSWVVW